MSILELLFVEGVHNIMSHSSFVTNNGDLVVRFTDSSGAVALMIHSKDDATSTFLTFSSTDEMRSMLTALSG